MQGARVARFASRVCRSAAAGLFCNLLMIFVFLVFRFSFVIISLCICYLCVIS